MHDTQASDLDQPDGVALAELLAPRIGVFPAISNHRDVANLIGARLAQDRNIRCPRNRAPHRFTAIVVVMRWEIKTASARTLGGKSYPNQTRLAYGSMRTSWPE